MTLQGLSFAWQFPLFVIFSKLVLHRLNGASFLSFRVKLSVLDEFV